jgi:ComF family protein
VDLLGLLLPQRCAACAVPGEPLCDACGCALRRLAEPLCARCGAPTAWPVARCRECAGRRLAFATARAAVAYDERARSLVSAWKEHGIRKLAAVAASIVAEALETPSVGAVTFIPPDPERLLKRGHHPAERLACELAVRWQLPVESMLLRTRSLPPQRGLSRSDRRKNVRGAFRARGHGVPRRIGLIDDVYTTGATVSAAASALRAAGARDVDVITFARTVRAGS